MQFDRCLLLLVATAACCCFCCFRCSLAAVPQLQDSDIQHWVSSLAQGLKTVESELKVWQLEADYKAASVKTVAFDASSANSLLLATKAKLEKFINKTEQQVQKIREAAETAYARHSPKNFSCSAFTDFPYLRATALVAAAASGNSSSNSSGSSNISSSSATKATAGVDFCSSAAKLALTSDPRLFNLPTSRQFSTAHVPPNIYDASNSILNIANWSASLDAVFKENAASDPSLKWQYFGATDGIMKLFPGVKWHLQVSDYLIEDAPIDFFDCRAQNWYLLAATYPKDVIILLDSSGSMKGSRSIIANKTVTDLLATLTPNDYFNLLVFMNNTVVYVSESHNRTLRQATEANKYEVKELIAQDQQRSSTLRVFPPYGISDHRVALREAFELLQLAKAGSVPASGGVQAIVMITDASPDTFADIFSQYNAEKQVRVAAYLIGQEASDLDVVRAIACNNRGYFAQISTLADVKEHVQHWVSLMATTNAMANDHFFVWTAVHTSQIVTQNMPVTEKRRLFTSVAQAAYDTVNATSSRQSAALIGIAGIDVPVDQLQRQAPDWQLGGLAYIFLVTNNGHVLLHPEYRLLDSAGHLSTFYENKDIADIEFPVSDSLTYSPTNYSSQLRDSLINAKSGSTEMTRLKTFQSFTRGQRQKYKYFYTPLVSSASGQPSSVSLGLALPWKGTGQQLGTLSYPSGTKADSLTDAQLVGSLPAEAVAGNCTQVGAQRLQAALGDYEFCDFPAQLLAEFNANPICCLAPALRLNSSQQAAIGCSQQFLRRVALDASVTKATADAWGSFGAAVRDKFGVGMVFLWTETGLSRWRSLAAPLDPSFVLLHRNASREDLYQQSALLNSAAAATATLSLTPPTPSASRAASASNSSAAQPLYLVAPIRTEAKGIVGVAGAELNSRSLAAEFLRVTSACAAGGSATCANCSQLGVRCYLLDTSAFVVVSEQPAELGLPFGTVECSAMQLLLQQGIFALTRAYDYQSTCLRKEVIHTGASTLFSPLRSAARLATWLLTEASLLLTDWSNYLLQPLGPSVAEGVVSVNSTSYTTEVIRGCHSYMLASVDAARLPPAATQKFLNVSCDSVNATCSCGNCYSNVYARPLPDTNLIFVAVATDAGGCSCGGCRDPTGEQSLTQHELKDQPPRNKPAWCPNTIRLVDNTTVCSSAFNSLLPNNQMLLMLLILLLLLPSSMLQTILTRC